jgi:hypothetical protein
MPTEQCNRVLVERYFLGEIGSEEKNAVRAHLDGCADCRGRMSALENERRDYLMAHPFREFAARHPDGKSPSESAATRRAPASRWLPGLIGAVACLVLVPVVLRYGIHDTVVSESGIRTKGGPVLEYYLKRGGAVTPGNASESHRAGDELQFVYSAGSHAYVTLASIDTRGHVSLYRPAEASADPAASTDAATPLSLAARAGDKQTLPFAVTLDDSPGAELFVMIFGSQALTGAEVERWLMEAYTRASGNLEALASRLPPPPGRDPTSEGKGGDEIRTLLLRKSRV